MKKQFDDYRWLAGGTGLRGSLWQGPDHLLVIEGRGFVFPYRETYRRIDFKNIQALALTRTKRRMWWTLLLALPACLLCWGALYFWGEAGVSVRNGTLRYVSGGSYAASISFTLLLMVNVALLAVNFLRGPRCRCSLQTAVLSLRLKPLRRMGRSMVVLSVLDELCRLHQGAMPEPTGKPLMNPDVAAAMLPPTKPEWRGSRAGRWAMPLLSLWGASFAAIIALGTAPGWFALVGVTHLLLALAAFVLLIMTVARALQHRGTGALAGICFGGIALELVAALTTYIRLIFMTVLTATGPRQTDFKPASLAKMLTNFDLAHIGKFGWFLIGLGLVGVALGVAGYPLVTRRGGRPAKFAPPLPASENDTPEVPRESVNAELGTRAAEVPTPNSEL